MGRALSAPGAHGSRVIASHRFVRPTMKGKNSMYRLRTVARCMVCGIACVAFAAARAGAVPYTAIDLYTLNGPAASGFHQAAAEGQVVGSSGGPDSYAVLYDHNGTPINL